MKQLLTIASALAVSLSADASLAAKVGSGYAAAPAAGNIAVVRAVSVIPNAGRAQVVIGVDGSVEIYDFRLESPHRIVVDLKGATLDVVPRYDRVMRGGVTNIQAAQFNADVVRVVIELASPHSYDVSRSNGEVRVAVYGSAGAFEAWYSSSDAAALADTSAKSKVASAAATAAERAEADTSDPDMRGDVSAQPEAPSSSVSPDPKITSASSAYRRANPSDKLGTATVMSEQPRITVTYQDADIRDVIAAFASFSGRTIVVGKDVSGTITAEVRNQPWDVALRAILQGQGLAAAEDAMSGIITVDSYKNIAARQMSEPVTTQLVAVNYASAGSLVGTLTGLLAKDCTPGGVPEAQQNARASCYSRGAVAADTATNTLLITETPSRMADLLRYVKSLDVRTLQVAIKAKIVFVNRTDIEEIGLSYDLGTGTDQFFGQLAPRIDPATREPVDTNGDGVPDSFGGGSPFNGDRILIGGNALSAIANANARIVNPALQLIFSAALGRFDLTTFLDALQEVRLADLQAEPSIVTLDNRKAEILVGQEIPIRVLDLSTQGQPGAAQATQVPRATVQLKEVGIILSVTPHITNNRQILLKLHAENSDAQLASSDVGFIFGKQRADNQLLVGDGETAVIGGLTVTQVTSSKSGIPLLVDLPIVGRLFGVTRTSEQKRDLLILVTPHIIDDGDRALSRTPVPARQ